MKCPKCNEEMRGNNHKGIDYEQCEGCGGLWFDALEAEELVEIQDADQIDTGDPKVGKQMGKKYEVKCPTCNCIMMPVHDVEQPHIKLESCPSCYGTFFDAGEFKDFCHETFMGRVKDWFSSKH